MTTLYKTNKNGSIQEWSIEVSGSTFTCIYGQVGGKMQSQKTTCKSMNVGRSNETTPEQQAQLEADALITKKIKTGYSYDKSAPVTVALPMKVKSYQDQIHNVIFPCYSDVKYNGVNGIYRRTNNLELFSRGGENYPAIPHLTEHINTILDELGHNEINGELYIHGEHLQNIQSAVKKPKQLSNRLTFIIFDISDSTEILTVRKEKLNKLFSQLIKIGSPILNYIGLAEYVICHSHDCIENHYNLSVSRGYEGTVVKNASGLYKHNVRSSDQFKYKKTQSAEFEIIGYELDKNGLPVFIMQCDKGNFKAKPVGTKEHWYNQLPVNYIGQYGTIEYETYSKSGIPLKPIFVSTREMDSNKNPKE